MTTVDIDISARLGNIEERLTKIDERLSKVEKNDCKFQDVYNNTTLMCWLALGRKTSNEKFDWAVKISDRIKICQESYQLSHEAKEVMDEMEKTGALTLSSVADRLMDIADRLAIVEAASVEGKINQ